jgi:DhnA family fructose-bisphosphate aldolase class Ia
MSSWQEGRIVNDLSTEATILSIAIAAGLGTSSAYTWLKLPVVADMERVMAATTLPTLLLGGDSGADPDETFAAWEDALSLPGVLGLTVGRTLLYPHDDDVALAVDTAARLVHTDPTH